MAGAFALLAGGLGADFAPALADEPFAEGFDAEPLLGAFDTAFAGAFAAAFAGAFAAGFAGALTAGLAAAAAFGAGAGRGRRRGPAPRRGFTAGRGPPVRSEKAPGRCGGAAAAAAAAAASRAAFSTAAFSAAILEAVGPRLLARRLLGVGVLGLADELVRLFLRHLAAAYHVLHEVARALDGESGETGGGADHVLHGRGDLAARLLADQLGPLGHLGHRVAHVGATVSRSAARCGGGAAGLASSVV